MYLPLILSFLMILGITIFTLQNGKPLDVNFLGWEFNTSLIAVILGSTLIGAIIVAIFSLPILTRKHFREKRLSKQVRDLENQLSGKKEVKFSSVDPPAKKN